MVKGRFHTFGPQSSFFHGKMKGRVMWNLPLNFWKSVFHKTLFFVWKNKTNVLVFYPDQAGLNCNHASRNDAFAIVCVPDCRPKKIRKKWRKTKPKKTRVWRNLSIPAATVTKAALPVMFRINHRTKNSPFYYKYRFVSKTNTSLLPKFQNANSKPSLPAPLSWSSNNGWSAFASLPEFFFEIFF